MSAKELLPCPFCGKEGWLFKHSSALIDEYSVRCEDGCCEVGDEYEADAIEAWNTRAPDIALTEQVEALREALSTGADRVEASGTVCEYVSRDMRLALASPRNQTPE